MRWLISLPLLLGALSACEDDEGLFPPDRRQPIIRPDFDPIGPDAEPIIIPVIAPEDLLDLDLDDLDGPLLIADPRLELDDLDGDGFPDVVLDIDGPRLGDLDLELPEEQ